jgi:NADH-quinone oxidoreductase subunit L
MGALAGKHSPVWLAAGLLGAFLTAYYSFRLIFIILRPSRIEPAHAEAHDDHGGGHHGAGIYRVMAAPLIILGAVTLVLGFFENPLAAFLARLRPDLSAHGAAHHAWLPPVAVGLALAGTALAWWEFGRRGAAQVGFVERVPALRELFAERWYLDRLYRRFLDYVIYGTFSNLFTRNDRRVIDGGIDGLCRATVGSGRLLSFVQSGMLQVNLMVMFTVMALVALGFYFLG